MMSPALAHAADYIRFGRMPPMRPWDDTFYYPALSNPEWDDEEQPYWATAAELRTRKKARMDELRSIQAKIKVHAIHQLCRMRIFEYWYGLQSDVDDIWPLSFPEPQHSAPQQSKTVTVRHARFARHKCQRQQTRWSEPEEEEEQSAHAQHPEFSAEEWDEALQFPDRLEAENKSSASTSTADAAHTSPASSSAEASSPSSSLPESASVPSGPELLGVVAASSEQLLQTVDVATALTAENPIVQEGALSVLADLTNVMSVVVKSRTDDISLPLPPPRPFPSPPIEATAPAALSDVPLHRDPIISSTTAPSEVDHSAPGTGPIPSPPGNFFAVAPKDKPEEATTVVIA